MEVLLKNKNSYVLPRNYTSVYISGENSNLKILIYLNIHSSTIYKSQDVEAT